MMFSTSAAKLFTPQSSSYLETAKYLQLAIIKIVYQHKINHNVDIRLKVQFKKKIPNMLLFQLLNLGIL